MAKKTGQPRAISLDPTKRTDYKNSNTIPLCTLGCDNTRK